MAVSSNDTIFLGHTASEQRKWLVAFFRHMRETHPKLHLPAVGEFTIAKTAIEAGYRPEDLYCSDISLFSRLLGALYSGTPVRSLPFDVSDERTADWADVADIYGDDDVSYVAFLMWVMKVCQLRKIPYQRAQADDLNVNRLSHIGKLRAQLVNQMQTYKGLHYEHLDMRDVLSHQYDSDEMVVVNPPVYAGGYGKMFDFGDDIAYDPDVPEFSWRKEYRPAWEASHEQAAPFLWYLAATPAGFPPEEIVFMREYNTKRQDSWMLTKPELLDGFKYNRAVVPMARAVPKPYRAPIFGPDDEITESSTIRFVKVDNATALYYRDLWAHKLGNTAAEMYLLMLVDGKVFSTLGLMLGDMFRLRTDYVFENYGFSAPSDRYPRINRLLMWAITSEDFGKFVRAHTSSVNRYWKCKGLRTTCLSKYRKVKLNNGILAVEKREKMPENNLYKIMYWADFRNETYADVISRFLTEEAAIDPTREEVA